MAAELAVRAVTPAGVRGAAVPPGAPARCLLNFPPWVKTPARGEKTQPRRQGMRPAGIDAERGHAKTEHGPVGEAGSRWASPRGHRGGVMEPSQSSSRHPEQAGAVVSLWRYPV